MPEVVRARPAYWYVSVRVVFIAYGIVVRSLPYICEWGRMGAPYHESWYTTTALLGAASFLTICTTSLDFLFCFLGYTVLKIMGLFHLR